MTCVLYCKQVPAAMASVLRRWASQHHATLEFGTLNPAILDTAGQDADPQWKELSKRIDFEAGRHCEHVEQTKLALIIKKLAIDHIQELQNVDQAFFPVALHVLRILNGDCYTSYIVMKLFYDKVKPLQDISFLRRFAGLITIAAAKVGSGLLDYIINQEGLDEHPLLQQRVVAGLLDITAKSNDVFATSFDLLMVYGLDCTFALAAHILHCFELWVAGKYRREEAIAGWTPFMYSHCVECTAHALSAWMSHTPAETGTLFRELVDDAIWRREFYTHKLSIEVANAQPQLIELLIKGDAKKQVGVIYVGGVPTRCSFTNAWSELGMLFSRVFVWPMQQIGAAAHLITVCDKNNVMLTTERIQIDIPVNALVEQQVAPQFNNIMTQLRDMMDDMWRDWNGTRYYFLSSCSSEQSFLTTPLSPSLLYLFVEGGRGRSSLTQPEDCFAVLASFADRGTTAPASAPWLGVTFHDIRDRLKKLTYEEVRQFITVEEAAGEALHSVVCRIVANGLIGACHHDTVPAASAKPKISTDVVNKLLEVSPSATMPFKMPPMPSDLFQHRGQHRTAIDRASSTETTTVLTINAMREDDSKLVADVFRRVASFVETGDGQAETIITGMAKMKAEFAEDFHNIAHIGLRTKMAPQDFVLWVKDLNETIQGIWARQGPRRFTRQSPSPSTARSRSLRRASRSRPALGPPTPRRPKKSLSSVSDDINRLRRLRMAGRISAGESNTFLAEKLKAVKWMCDESGALRDWAMPFASDVIYLRNSRSDVLSQMAVVEAIQRDARYPLPEIENTTLWKSRVKRMWEKVTDGDWHAEAEQLSDK